MNKRVSPIHDQVYWIDGGASNFYLIVEPTGLTLVDSGMPRRAPLVFETISYLGYQPTDLKRLLITHTDIDHVGSMAEIQRRSGCQVVVSRQTAVYFRQRTYPRHMFFFAQWVVNTFMKFDPVPEDALLLVKEGDTLPILDQLYVIHSPGHTPDHHAFFSPVTGILFSGDALHTRTGQLSASSDPISSDRLAVARSAIRLLELAPAIFACGHGRPLTEPSSEESMQLFQDLRQKVTLL